MSDSHQTPTTSTGLAIVYLALTFAAGPVLVYSVDANTRSADSRGAAPPPSPAPPALPAQLTAQLAATSRRVATLEAAIQRLEQAQTAALAAEPMPTLEEELAAIGARRTAEGMLISFAESDLSFRPGDASLSRVPSAALAKVTALLARHQELRILVRGHTDSQGSAPANQSLSEQRALTLVGMLVASGIAADRIQSEGLGESRPVADNQSAEGRARNRRVELYLNRPER